jgi:hypothetical protein
MHIDWAAFAEVFVVSFGVAVGIIILFAIGVTLLSAPASSPDGPRRALSATDGAGPRTTAASRGSTTSRQVTAWICFLACALSVAYGLHIIIAK